MRFMTDNSEGACGDSRVAENRILPADRPNQIARLKEFTMRLHPAKVVDVVSMDDEAIWAVMSCEKSGKSSDVTKRE